jgi:hypothetical protein
MPKTLTLHSTWALEIADHASARLLQRSPETDLPSAILESAQAFAASDAGSVAPLISSPATIYLPAGSGCFLATVIGGVTKTGKEHIYARCRTVVPQTWMRADQILLARADDAERTVALALWDWGRVGELLE